MSRAARSPFAGTALSVAAAAALAACTSLAPRYERPAAPVPPRFDAPAGVAPAADAAMPSWDALVLDADIRALVALTLANNRDLRVAALNVERARAAEAIADAGRLPRLGLGASAQRAPNNNGVMTNSFQAGLTVSAYEFDLFGRLALAEQAAGAGLLAAQHAQRATRLALITQCVAGAIGVQADAQLLALAQSQLKARAETLRLVELRAQAGAASDLELATARTLVAQAQVSVAQTERQRAQDRHALALVMGQSVPDAFPAALAVPTAAAPAVLGPVPVRLDSAVLLTRPDVMAAEQQLVAANANIGVARAAKFPKLALTGTAGETSGTLASLASGTLAWSLLLQATMPIIDWGRNEEGEKSAVADRDVAVAQYEKALQIAFRDVADALSGQDTWRGQREAAEVQRDAEATRNRLTHLRYDQGSASLLELLDAERSSAAAEAALVQARQGEAVNRLVLYKALGGS